MDLLVSFRDRNDASEQVHLPEFPPLSIVFLSGGSVPSDLELWKGERNKKRKKREQEKQHTRELVLVFPEARMGCLVAW